MTAARIFALLLCLAAALPTCGCASNAGTGPRRPVSTVGTDAQAFDAMGLALLRGAAARERGEANALRALGPGLSSTGMALLRARMPHDLRRSDVGLFLEARAAFGDALKLWVRTLAEGSDVDVLGGYDAVVEAYHAWVGAYRGLRPERAV